MDERKRFIEIFSGLERAYGQTQSRSKNESGKLEAKSWIEKEQLTEQKWIDHLDGKEPSLGIIPIRDDNTCTWGAIDIDTYDGFDHKKLIDKISDCNMTFITYSYRKVIWGLVYENILIPLAMFNSLVFRVDMNRSMEKLTSLFCSIY